MSVKVKHRRRTSLHVHYDRAPRLVHLKLQSKFRGRRPPQSDAKAVHREDRRLFGRESGSRERVDDVRERTNPWRTIGWERHVSMDHSNTFFGFPRRCVDHRLHRSLGVPTRLDGQVDATSLQANEVIEVEKAEDCVIESRHPQCKVWLSLSRGARRRCGRRMSVEEVWSGRRAERLGMHEDGAANRGARAGSA